MCVRVRVCVCVCVCACACVCTFMTSNLSSSQRTNTEDEADRGREVASVATSWASLLARAAVWVDDVALWTRDS